MRFSCGDFSRRCGQHVAFPLDKEGIWSGLIPSYYSESCWQSVHLYNCSLEKQSVRCRLHNIRLLVLRNPESGVDSWLDRTSFTACEICHQMLFLYRVTDKSSLNWDHWLQSKHNRNSRPLSFLWVDGKPVDGHPTLVVPHVRYHHFPFCLLI